MSQEERIVERGGERKGEEEKMREKDEKEKEEREWERKKGGRREREERQKVEEKRRKSDGVNWSPDARVFFSQTQTNKNWELTGLWISMVNTPQACMHAVT